jgi:cell division protein FtsW
VKFAIIIYLAAIFAKYRGKKNILHNKDFLIRFFGSVGLSLFFVVVLQKDLGSGVPIAVISLFMLFQSGVPIRSFAIICLAALILGVGAIMTSSHRRERLWTYLGISAPAEHEEDDDADAYHIENALIAIGTGGLLGVGIGNSVQATGYLPESINDSVFAIMGETFGFIKLVLVLVGFAWLLMRILKVSDYSPDFQNSMIAVGAFAWIMTHLVVNVMAMTNIIPLTGITLPLLSYGGTSMMAVAGILGLTYQLSQYTSREIVTDTQRKAEILDVNEGFSRNIRYEQVNYRRRR